MTELALSLGEVSNFADTTLVGSGALWADNNDATYTHSVGVGGSVPSAQATVDTLTMPAASVTAIGWRHRGSADGGSVTCRIDVWTPSGFLIRLGGFDGFGITGDLDTREEWNTQADFDSYGRTLLEVAEAFAAGGAFIRLGALSGTLITTEFELLIAFAGGNPPEQIYPRSDGLATGSADQVYPIPDTYQASADQWGGHW